MSRPIRWVIELDGRGQADVLCAGRQLRAGLPVEQALRYVRTRREAGDKVYREDPDGYRTEITRSL